MSRPLSCTSLSFNHPLLMITRVTKIDTQIEPLAMPFRKDRRLNIASASQAVCPFFEKLPPELRNQIYEYVFTPEKSRHRALVTATFKRPESNFLLPCQRVFVEANCIFEVARTSYWKRSTFYVDLLSKDMSKWPSSCEIVNYLHKRELKMILRPRVQGAITSVWRDKNAASSRVQTIPGARNSGTLVHMRAAAVAARRTLRSSSWHLKIDTEFRLNEQTRWRATKEGGPRLEN